jgi:hypothetical protein
MSGELCGLVSPVSRMRQVEDATMRAKRVRTANLTGAKTEGKRYPVDALDPENTQRSKKFRTDSITIVVCIRSYSVCPFKSRFRFIIGHSYGCQSRM